MAKTTIGYAHCPECHSVEAVQTDGLKYFIHCNACGTYIHYQRKEAKQRVPDKLLTDMTGSLEPIKTESKTDNASVCYNDKSEAQQPKEKPKAPPKKPVVTPSFFEFLTEYL